jgi:TolB-like protein/tetratricopeptide (TPR) repeat protein
MATVYLAEDRKHHRKVAVKVLRPELAATLGADRFHREIEIAANLNHPHVLPLLDSGEADTFLYYVMPFVEGESLRDKLAHEGELPIGEAVRILRDVVDALSEAHEKGVVHRDIKPDNVLLTKHHALVTDFGVAKAVSEATGAEKLTTEGVALGTPAYMSPEQAAADSHIDRRADIYAVGVVAYELLTGRTPFLGTTPQMILSAHITDTPEPVTKYRESVPPALEQLVMKCLEKKAADRWQSAEELLPQLEALATPSGGITPTGTMPVDRVVKRRWMMVGSAVGVVAVFALMAAIAALPRGNGRALDPNRVLVVPFTDQSGLREAQALGRMAQDYIIQILTEAQFAEVVDPLTALVVSQNVAAGDILALADEAQAGTVVSGSCYAEGDSVHIQTRITDASNGRLLGTVGPIVGSLGAHSDLVARLGREVVAALAALLDQELGSFEPGTQPATYEAYEAYNEGLDAYLEAWDAEGYAEAARHFERAAAADPTFSRARLWGAQTYFLIAFGPDGWSRHAKGESLIARLVETPGQLNRYERCRLDFVIALQRWNDVSAGYEAARCMAEAAPGSDDAKREVANFALYRNRPGEAIELLRQLDPDRGLIKHSVYYWAYLSMAHHMVGDYEGELEVAREGLQRFLENPDLLLAEARALAALGRLGDVTAVVETMRSLPSKVVGGSRFLLASVAEELRAHGHPDAAREVIDESIAWVQARPQGTEESRAELANLLYRAERWADAQRLYEQLAEEYPETTASRRCCAAAPYLAALGKLAARRGDRAEASRISEELRSLRYPPRETLRLTLERARIAALLGDREEAMTLIQLFDQGGMYQWWRHGDIDFESLRDYPPFQELIRPKG